MTKTLVQEQFGKTAASYLDSRPHARGSSLQALLEKLEPQPFWHVLDVATGAGHVAYTFAPFVEKVIATDVTQEMLDVVSGELTRRQISNVEVQTAKAEALPFGGSSFDAVISRIAPHHFDDIGLFLREARRVLKPGGHLAIVDNVVPDNEVGHYINAFERLRDPSHVRALSADEWIREIEGAGYRIDHQDHFSKTLYFEEWAARHDANMQAFLRAMLSQGSAQAIQELEPTTVQGGLTFRLKEGFFVASKT
jgi:ubiquinone/menaquinone biosynthesis C-methylase UbiE